MITTSSSRYTVTLPKLLVFLAAVLSAAAHAQYTLVWSDEFRNFDDRNWTHQTGDGCQFGICGWGNSELQWYRPANTAIVNHPGANGKALRIRMTREGSQLYSSRLVTQGKREFRRGRIAARIQRTYGNGIWPAFWMLGTQGGTWPANGEIDIMEQRNHENMNYGAIHWQDHNDQYAMYSGGTPVDGRQWHIYSLEWDQHFLRWFVDGQLFHEANISGGINGTNEFHNWPFYLLINLAAGSSNSGFTLGQSAVNTPMPQDLYIDWIRVWQDTNVSGTICAGCTADGTHRWEATNFPGLFIRHQNSRGRISSNVNPYADSQWRMVRGLTGQGTVSFQSINFPDRYLRHRNSELWIDYDDGSDLFAADASWIQQQGLSGNGFSFESWNFRGRYLRHRNSLLYMDNNDGSNLFRADASFHRR